MDNVSHRTASGASATNTRCSLTKPGWAIGRNTKGDSHLFFSRCVQKVTVTFFREGTRQISINQEPHLDSAEGMTSLSLARYAANHKTALRSSSVRGGYSRLISSAGIPSAKASRSTYTGVRVPLMHGFPCWIFGSVAIRPAKSFAFICGSFSRKYNTAPNSSQGMGNFQEIKWKK